MRWRLVSVQQGRLGLHRPRFTHALVESFHGRARDEWLNGRQSDSLRETKVLIEGWCIAYNINRPRSAHSERIHQVPGPPDTNKYTHRSSTSYWRPSEVVFCYISTWSYWVW